MDETWDSKILAKKMFEIIPKLTRLMTRQMTTLTENETTMMQIGVLHMLMQNRMTTSALAKKRKVSLQAASAFVQSLVDRDWVVRVEDPKDRRRAILDVTLEGQQQAEALRMQITEQLSHLMSDLSLEEISAAQIFLNGLDLIVQKYNLGESCRESD
jgi:DNA-binding MarR family transcriptional regulator